jgi:hypothetical protein
MHRAEDTALTTVHGGDLGNAGANSSSWKKSPNTPTA